MAYNAKNNETFEQSKVRNRAINIATDATNADNPAYIIDRKLLDTLLKRYTSGSLDDLKAEMIGVINKSEGQADMFDKLEEHIYCNKIANAVGVLDSLMEQEAANNIGRSITE